MNFQEATVKKINPKVENHTLQEIQVGCCFASRQANVYLVLTRGSNEVKTKRVVMIAKAAGAGHIQSAGVPFQLHVDTEVFPVTVTCEVE